MSASQTTYDPPPPAHTYVAADEAGTHASAAVKIHTAEHFAQMRTVGLAAAELLDKLEDHVRPGVRTAELNEIVLAFADEHDAIPAPLHYRGFTGALCTSLNHVVCHGIPGARSLKEGDIVNLDITLIKDGWHGDTSRMFYVGAPSRKARRLVETTYDAMMLGIAAARPGAHLGDIGQAIADHAHAEGMSVVREFCGHGIGRIFHDAPNIFHYGQKGEGVELRTGMFFTIEPMINLGGARVKLLSDGWTAVTRDRSLSAQFEHTIGITETGCEIFTRSPAGRDEPPRESPKETK